MRYAGKDSLGDTIVLLEDGRLYSESAAVLRIARHLTLPWRWLVLPGWLFPVSVRNSLYRFIARNRYRWFGKKDACYLPSPGLAERFLP